MTESVTDNGVNSAPDPERGWSRDIVTLTNPVVFPPLSARGHWVPAGIRAADGSYCPQGATWRYTKRMTVKPQRHVGEVPVLAGRWLWCGLLMGHFGHFLTESTTRLWALDHVEGRLDGLVFVPKRPRANREMLDYQRAILALMGIDLPVRVVAEPTRIGELVVPGQGFGLGEISRGTPEMRAMIHRRFGASIGAEGPPRLYLSRSGLGEAESMILGETVLEGHLMANGYEIFHPQNHDLATQIARYKAAREIIVADGSAAHLFGMVGRPDQRVAFLMRRSYWSEFPLLHLEHFCGRKPDIVDAVRREWVPVHPNHHKHVSFGEMDLPMVQGGLVEAGYIAAGGTSWPPLSETVADAAFLRMGLAGEFRPGSG